MALTIYLTNRRGERLERVQAVPLHLADRFPRYDDSMSACSRFIDRYGYTTFNGRQCRALLEEVAALPDDGDDEVKQWKDEIISLARRAAEGPHLFLYFVGD